MIQTILLIFTMFISFTFAQPPNDLPCNAIDITSPGTIAADTSTANSESHPSCGTSNNGANSVWFHIPGQIRDLTVSTCGTEGGSSNYDSKLNIFQPDTCGCIDCADPSSFICVDGNDDSCSDGTSWLRSTVSISGTYCNLYVVLHGYSSSNGDAVVSFDYTPIDQTTSNSCPDCGKSFAPSKGECEECLSWNAYLDTLCAANLALQPIDFQDLLARENNCLDNLICLLDNGPGSVVTFTGDGDEDNDDELRPEATIRKGICVAEDGKSTTVTTCNTDAECPLCMRCCADQDGKNKECKRSSGDICGLTFEGRGPCCCPEYACKGNECVTQSPTPAPTESPTPSPTPSPTQLPTPSPTQLPTPSPTQLPTASPTDPTQAPHINHMSADGDDNGDNSDDEQQFYAVEQMLNAKNNENENINSVTAMLKETLMALWSMIVVIIVGIIAMITYKCFYLYKKKGQASFKHDTNQDIEDV